MSDVSTLLERNQNLTEKFTGGDLTGRPRLSTILLTCVDARVDPVHIFGLEPGDAVVIRTAGGRITPGALQDLAILGVLAANAPGPSPMRPELVVIHHTQCGMGQLAHPSIQQQVAERLGITLEEASKMAIADPETSLRSDIDRLRAIPSMPDGLIVSGLVYDVTDGTIDEIVAPAPLRPGRP